MKALLKVSRGLCCQNGRPQHDARSPESPTGSGFPCRVVGKHPAAFGLSERFEPSGSTDANGLDDTVTLEVWHTFAAESKEENVFLQSIKAFESIHPNITVEVALVPFGDADQFFMTAAQGVRHRFDAPFQ